MEKAKMSRAEKEVRLFRTTCNIQSLQHAIDLINLRTASFHDESIIELNKAKNILISVRKQQTALYVEALEELRKDE